MRADLRQTETVKRAIAEAASWLCTGISVDLDMWAEETDDENARLESPIEAVFATWWQVVAWARSMHGTTEALWLEPQQNVEIEGRRYRLDFAVQPADPEAAFDAEKYQLGIPYPSIAVELDGHEFHERTKEQVALRNQRDRDLQTAGWKVFHFSGSEIYRNACTHVAQVFDYAEGQWSAYRRTVRQAKKARGITS